MTCKICNSIITVPEVIGSDPMIEAAKVISTHIKMSHPEKEQQVAALLLESIERATGFVTYVFTFEWVQGADAEELKKRAIELLASSVPKIS